MDDDKVARGGAFWRQLSSDLEQTWYGGDLPQATNQLAVSSLPSASIVQPNYHIPVANFDHPIVHIPPQPHIVATHQNVQNNVQLGQINLGNTLNAGVAPHLAGPILPGQMINGGVAPHLAYVGNIRAGQMVNGNNGNVPGVARRTFVGPVLPSNIGPPALENRMKVVRLIGLPFGATEADVIAFLGDIDVIDVLIVREPSGHSTGMSFVVLSSEAGITAALARNNTIDFFTTKL